MTSLLRGCIYPALHSTDEPDAIPAQQISRNSSTRKRYVPPKITPEPEPVAIPTQRSLRSRAVREEVVRTTVTRKEEKSTKKMTKDEDEDGGLSSIIKVLLFAVAGILFLTLMIYIMLEGSPSSPELAGTPDEPLVEGTVTP